MTARRPEARLWRLRRHYHFYASYWGKRYIEGTLVRVVILVPKRGTRYERAGSIEMAERGETEGYFIRRYETEPLIHNGRKR